MKWNELPEGATLSMSKEDAMALRGGGPRTFVAGMICGAVLLVGLQSCGADDGKTPPKPKPTKTATVQQGAS